MMKKNIIWKGLQNFKTIEHCELQYHNGEYIVSSEISGRVDGHEVFTTFLLKLDENWKTSAVEINNSTDRKESHFFYTVDHAGNWQYQGAVVPALQGCIEVDIMFTPFTNSLPINRLKMEIGESRSIAVVYFDLLEPEVKRVEQIYTRISELKYKYENVANAFKAIITVNEFGLVTAYTDLFEMESFS